MTSITTIFIPELLQKIFSYHKENPKMMFQCALVSKSWCDTAVPFLWKNPFRLGYSTFHYKIVRVYLQFLSKEFLEEIDLNRFSQIPSYNYLSFLQELVYLALYESLINLLKKQKCYSEDDQDCSSCFHPPKQFMIKKIFPILNELCGLFMKNGTRINCFNLSAPFVNCKCKWIPSNYITFPSLPQSSKSLSSLQSFICDNNGYDFNDIIMELSKYSKHILTIEIKKPQTNQNISRWITLINSQRYLRKLKLEFFYSQDSSRISLSIPSQYHSLKEVELVYCKFSQTTLLDELSKCSNLISLKIKDCSFSDPSSSSSPSHFLDCFEKNPQSINYFTSLKSLFISKSDISQDYFLSFIGQPSKLERINLNLIDFFKYPKIIPFIYLNCSNLKILDIVLVEETFEKIIPIIENCKLLEEISILEKYDWIGHEFYNYHDSYIGNYMNSNQVIKEISNRLPENLKKFHFPQIFNFTLKEIQIFIQNSPITLQNLRFYAIIKDKNDVIDLLENFALINNRKSIIKHNESFINYDVDKTIHHIFVAKFS